MLILFYGDVAQLARAFGSYPECHRFDSCHRYQSDYLKVVAIFMKKAFKQWGYGVFGVILLEELSMCSDTLNMSDAVKNITFI